MADPSQTPQLIEMPPAFIVGDKSHDPSDNDHGGTDNSVRSRNIEFDRVEIVGTPPQVIEMPPLEITVPKPDSSSKESSASPDSRVTFSSPASESKLQQDSKPTEISTTPVDRIQVETPEKESPTTASDFSHRRQNWSDGPFDDHTGGGRLPSFVYPNKTESNSKSRLSKRKGKKKRLITLDDFVITGKQVDRAVKTESKTEQGSLTIEALKTIVSKLKTDSTFKKQIEGNPFENLLTIPHSGRFRNYALAWINTFTSIPDEWGNPKYPPRQYYDPTEEETKALVCDGIHETIAKILQSDPEINSQFHPEITSRTASRLFGNFIHTAIKIYFEGNEYVLDYWMRLEYDNPMIYRYDDWYSGNDSKGIEFNSIIDNTRNNN
jgi:imidazoleglycerol phosphate synthase glutamine amidotransferase subunit HisH